jgi:hypothetical protein
MPNMRALHASSLSFGSVSDPDPDWGIPVHAGKTDPQKKKKSEVSCFEVMNILFGGLETSSAASNFMET